MTEDPAPNLIYIKKTQTKDKIKFTVAHPASNNVGYSHHSSVYKLIVLIKYFHLIESFFFFMTSLIFNIAFN